MECKQLEKELDLIPSMDTNDSYFSEAIAHTQSCQACLQKVEKRLIAEESIQQTMEIMATVPETLISTLIRDTRASRSFVTPWRTLGWAAAALLLLVGAGSYGYSYLTSYQMEHSLKRVCALSIKNHELYQNPEFFSDDPKAVSKWLSKRFNRLIPVPKFIAKRTLLEGARRCALAEHAAAVIHFELDGRRSTLFSFYPEQFNIKGASQKPKVDMGYTVSVWNENGIAYSLVSEASVEKVNAALSLTGEDQSAI